MFMLPSMPSPSPLQRAINAMGSQAALARALEVPPQQVWNWINRDHRVSAEHVLAIEKATAGKVTRHDLRPDLYPRERAA